MTLEEMENKMIREFGFEYRWTVWFLTNEDQFLTQEQREEAFNMAYEMAQKDFE